MRTAVPLLLTMVALSFSVALSQTMTVKMRIGDKTYNLEDISSITFGKLNPGGSIEMVLIPAGSFDMGQMGVEVPVHKVTLTRPYFMGRYEITQKQYAAVMGTNPSSFGGKDNNPVDRVKWTDAVQFCNKLSKSEGLEECYSLQDTTYVCDFSKKGYRLPTEAEWEFACRAGTVTDYYTGSTTQACSSAGWYDRNANKTTQQVGLKQANGFGLYDMHGNVWELCWDWLAEYPAVAVVDPVGPATGKHHVLRGGSWNSIVAHCLSAFRHYYFYPNGEYEFFGFRVARTK